MGGLHYCDECTHKQCSFWLNSCVCVCLRVDVTSKLKSLYCTCLPWRDELWVQIILIKIIFRVRASENWQSAFISSRRGNCNYSTMTTSIPPLNCRLSSLHLLLHSYAYSSLNGGLQIFFFWVVWGWQNRQAYKMKHIYEPTGGPISRPMSTWHTQTHTLCALAFEAAACSLNGSYIMWDIY